MTLTNDAPAARKSVCSSLPVMPMMGWFGADKEGRGGSADGEGSSSGQKYVLF